MGAATQGPTRSRPARWAGTDRTLLLNRGMSCVARTTWTGGPVQPHPPKKAHSPAAVHSSLSRLQLISSCLKALFSPETLARVSKMPSPSASANIGIARSTLGGYSRFQSSRTPPEWSGPEVTNVGIFNSSAAKWQQARNRTSPT